MAGLDGWTSSLLERADKTMAAFGKMRDRIIQAPPDLAATAISCSRTRRIVPAVRRAAHCNQWADYGTYLQ
jgi:hypothetical protein